MPCAQVSILLLIQLVAAENLWITLTGELTVELIATAVNQPTSQPESQRDSVKAAQIHSQVLEELSQTINVDKKCINLQVDSRLNNNSNNRSILATYQASLAEHECGTLNRVLSLSDTRSIGLKAVHVNHTIVPDFWADKINSILVFCGAAVLVIIILVPCIVFLTKVHRRELHYRAKAKISVEDPNQSYAADTMVMEGSSQNYQCYKDAPGTTTIERWVRSQLNKSRRRLSRSKAYPSFVYKKETSQQDLSTTDSGIVVTRRASDVYATIDNDPPTLRSHYKKIEGYSEMDYHDLENSYSSCLPVTFSANSAYITDDGDRSLQSVSIEECSKL